MSHFYGSNFFWKLDDHHFFWKLDDIVACLEPKLWSKKPILPQNQKIAENALSLPLAAFRFLITRR